MTRRVLVAGGTGLVGSALVSLLRARGDRISVLTRFPSRVPPLVDAIALERWHPEAVETALDGLGFDLLFNLAAYGVDPADNDPREALVVNCEVARRLVSIAARAQARLVHVGSVFEYAPWPHRYSIPEDAPLETGLAYGTTKAQGSLAVLATARQIGSPVLVARLFGVYGASERPHRLLPSLLSALMTNRRVPLSTGEQVRDVMHVDDAAEGLVALAEIVASASSDIVNLCTGEPTSVRDLATLTADIVGAPRSLLGFGDIPARPQDASWLVGDTSRLFSLSKWRPRLTLRSGLEDVVRSWRRNLEAKSHE